MSLVIVAVRAAVSTPARASHTEASRRQSVTPTGRPLVACRSSAESGGAKGFTDEPDEAVIVEPRMSFGLDIHRRIHLRAMKQMAYQAQWRAYCERCACPRGTNAPVGPTRVMRFFVASHLTTPPSSHPQQRQTRLARLRVGRRRDSALFLSVRAREGYRTLRGGEACGRAGIVAAEDTAPDAGSPGAPSRLPHCRSGRVRRARDAVPRRLFLIRIYARATTALTRASSTPSPLGSTILERTSVIVVAAAVKPRPSGRHRRAVKGGLAERRVHLVVRSARPLLQRHPRGGVRWIALDDFGEVRGAYLARVHPGEDVDEITSVLFLLTRRVVRELRGEGVQEEPRGSAKLLAGHRGGGRRLRLRLGRTSQRPRARDEGSGRGEARVRGKARTDASSATRSGAPPRETLASGAARRRRRSATSCGDRADSAPAPCPTRARNHAHAFGTADAIVVVPRRAECREGGGDMRSWYQYQQITSTHH